MNPKRILIVDDSPILVKALSNVLSGAGYEVLKAQDGSDAVSIARREHPDLMLLDITFPPDVAHGGGIPWDGFLIMSWIRRMPECRDIPIIIVSGSEAEKFGKRALECGAAAYFQKPVEPGELLDTVRQVLETGVAGTVAPPDRSGAQQSDPDRQDLSNRPLRMAE